MSAMRALLVFVLVLVAEARSQQLVRELPANDYYWSYTNAGDVDGDGSEDMIATARVPVGPGAVDYELRFYSGRDASLIRRGPYWLSPEGGFSYRHGDHDHDGMRDYLCWERGAPSNIQYVNVRSGRDDHVLCSIPHPGVGYWAHQVVGNIDLNGDGELDVLVSHPLSLTGPSYGTIWAYDHNGSLLYQLSGPVIVPGYTYALAQSLAKLGDVNGDGCDDYICGLGDSTWYGAVAVISGPTGQILRIVRGANYADYIGSGCVGLGDLDGDGLPDFAAGGGLSSSWGSVQAFSGATGTPLFAHYSGTYGDRYGVMLERADYDNDGVDDILAPTYLGLRVVSGREGVQIGHFAPNTANYGWGAFRTVGVRTADGFCNLLIQTSTVSAFLTSRPHHSEPLGPGCAITAATTPSAGMRELGARDRRLTLHGAEPGAVAFLLLGLADASPGAIGLAPIGLPTCSLYPSVQVLGGFTTGTGGLDAGFVKHDIAVPTTSAFGLGIDAQWLTLDSTLAVTGLSAGLRFAMTPTQ